MSKKGFEKGWSPKSPKGESLLVHVDENSHPEVYQTVQETLEMKRITADPQPKRIEDLRTTNENDTWATAKKQAEEKGFALKARKSLDKPISAQDDELHKGALYTSTREIEEMIDADMDDEVIAKNLGDGFLNKKEKALLISRVRSGEVTAANITSLYPEPEFNKDDSFDHDADATAVRDFFKNEVFAPVGDPIIQDETPERTRSPWDIENIVEPKTDSSQDILELTPEMSIQDKSPASLKLQIQKLIDTGDVDQAQELLHYARSLESTAGKDNTSEQGVAQEKERILKNSMETEEARAERFKERNQLRHAARNAKALYEEVLQKEQQAKQSGVSGAAGRLKEAFMGGKKMSKHVEDLKEAYVEVEQRRIKFMEDSFASFIKTSNLDKNKERSRKARRGLALKRVEKYSQIKLDAIEKGRNEKFEKALDVMWRKRGTAYKVLVGTGLMGGITAATGGFATAAAAGAYGIRRAATASFMLTGGAAILNQIGEKDQNKVEALRSRLIEDFKSVDDSLSDEELEAELGKQLEALDGKTRRSLHKRLGLGLLLGAGAGLTASGVLEKGLDVAGSAAADSSNAVLETEPVYVDDYNSGLDPNAPFERAGVTPIDGSLEGSSEWQGQAPGGFEVVEEVPIKATSMEIGQAGSYSEHVNGRIDGGIEAMQEFRAQLRAEYPDTPRPDVVEKILSYDNPVDAAKAFGFFRPEADVPNMNGSESFVLQPGDTFNINESGEFVFTHNGEEHTLLSDAGERGDAVVGDIKKVGMIESLKDQFKNYTNTEQYKVAVCPPGEELPFGVDGRKVYYTEDGQLLAYAEYADDQAYWGVQAGDLSFYDANGIQTEDSNESFISTPVYKEDVSGQEYSNPTAEHIKSGYAFERDGRYYYYNHDNYPNGNPYGENFPLESQKPVEMVYEQMPQILSTQEISQESSDIGPVKAPEQSLFEKFDIPRKLDSAARYLESTFIGDLKNFDVNKLPVVLQNGVVSDNVPLNGKTIDVMRFANDAESGINVIPFFNEEEGTFQTLVQTTRMDAAGNVQSEIIDTYTGSPKETMYQALERVYRIRK